MRRLNVKFLICLVVPVLLIAGGLHLLRAINVERSTDLVLEKAKIAVREGDLRQALVHYGQYLARNPHDKEQVCEAALAAADMMGEAKSNLSEGDVRSAYQFLARAVRNAPERHDIRRRLANLLVKIGQYPEAREQFVQLEASGESDPQMQFDDALCSANLNEVAKAIDRLNVIVGYDPQKQAFDAKAAGDASLVDAYVLLAELLFTKQDNQPLADRVMDQLVTANPQSADAHVKLARYLRGLTTRGEPALREARLARAHQIFQKAHELAPTDLDVLLENALLAMGEKKYDEAGKVLKIAKSEHPQDSRVYVLQGRVAVLQQDFAGAIREYEAGLEQIPDNFDLIWYMFESQLQTKDVASAQVTVDRMKRIKFPSERVALAEAQILFLQEKWLEASEKLEGVRPQLASNPGLALHANLLLAGCYAPLRQVDRELECYRRAIQLDQGSLPAVRGLISTLVRLQQYPEAFGWLIGVRKSLGDEDFAKDRALASAFYQVAKVLQQQRPDDRNMLEALKGAEKILGQAVAGDQAPETLLAIDQSLKDKNMDRAAEDLRSALRKQPDDELLQHAYLRVLVAQEGPAKGLEFLEAALKRGWKDTAFIRGVRSQLYLEVNDPKVKAKLAELEVGIDGFSAEDQFQIWRTLGAAYYGLSPRDYDSVQRCWETAIKLRPTDLETVHLLFDLSRERGDQVGMVVALDVVNKAFGPESPEAKYFRARQLVGRFLRDPSDRTVLDEAVGMTEELAKVRPGWYWVALLNAQVSELQGLLPQAISAYQDALKLGPPRAESVRRLIELLMAENRFPEARSALESLNPLPRDMVRYKVLLEALGGDPQKALAALRGAVAVDSTNPADFLWKGRVLSHLKQTDEATKVFVRAVQLGPSLPQTWLTLIEHLVRNGRPSDAEGFIRQAENQLSPDITPLVMAQAYALLGNHVLAEYYYQTALEVQPEDPVLLQTVASYYLGTGRSSKAEHYLKKTLQLANSGNPSQATHAVWARRMLAETLGREGSYARFRTALALLEANRVDGNLAEADERIKAELMGGREEPQYRDEAVRVLERIKMKEGTTPLSLAQAMLLARLYELSKRWGEARDLMLDLVGENPRNPDVIAQLCDMQLSRKEIDVVTNWIDKLAEIEPGSYRTLRLRARRLVGRGDSEEAVKLIDAWLPSSLKPSEANRVLQAAGLLEELEFLGEAEKKFAVFDKLVSSNSLAVASFMARHGRMDEAFKLAAGRVSDENIQGVAMIGMLAITTRPMKATDTYFQQAQEWFDRAMQKNSGDLGLMLNWSSALDALGKSDEAEKILKEVLSKDLTTQQRGIVVNNLAYMQAVQGVADADTMRQVDTAARLIGPHPSVLDSRAMIYLSQGDCAQAIDQLTEATRFGADSGLYYFHLARAHQCAGDRSSARRAMKQAKGMGFTLEQLGAGERQQYQQLESWLAL